MKHIGKPIVVHNLCGRAGFGTYVNQSEHSHQARCVIIFIQLRRRRSEHIESGRLTAAIFAATKSFLRAHQMRKSPRDIHRPKYEITHNGIERVRYNIFDITKCYFRWFINSRGFVLEIKAYA